MADLISSAITSLDGYLEDADGGFGWAEPGPEVHAFVNDLERSVATYLYGRRMYETMVWWEDEAHTTGEPDVIQDYGRIWRSADKVVYSRGLSSVSSARTRIEPSFDVDAVRAMKAAADGDLGIGGPGLAEHAWAAGLVDVLRLFVVPVLVGAGKSALPAGRHDLVLEQERRFDDGTLFLQYRTRH